MALLYGGVTSERADVGGAWLPVPAELVLHMIRLRAADWLTGCLLLNARAPPPDLSLAENSSDVLH
jgi:hypothetical protein